MTIPSPGAANSGSGDGEVRFTDKRRVDPETGEVRQPQVADDSPSGEKAETGSEAGEVALQAQVDSLTDQLQRLQAEYVNYRKRVDRDRDVAREETIVSIVDALLPVFDDIDFARAHDELSGPFEAIVEKLETTLARFGWERYGEVGEPFDPTVHDALMHSTEEGVEGPTVDQILQYGYRAGDRIVRAARVAVVDAAD